MGSGTAKKVRLELGIDLRQRVHDNQGTDEDIVLVQEEAGDDFLNGIARQIVERAGIIRGDRDCFRLTNPEIVIEMPALKRPTLERLKKDYGVRSIERDDSTEEAVTLRLATVLKSDEASIGGEVYERRLVPVKAKVKLGFQHAEWLVANQDKLPEPVRSALKELLGKIYIDFAALVVVGEDGDRSVPYVNRWGDKRWHVDFDWLGSDFSRYGRVAVSSE